MHNAILLAPSLILGGILLWTLWAQHKERERQARDLLTLTIDHVRERTDLIQRIQAPQAAIEEHERRQFAQTVRESMPERTPEEIEEEQRQTMELSQVGTVVNGDVEG